MHTKKTLHQMRHVSVGTVWGAPECRPLDARDPPATPVSVKGRHHLWPTPRCWPTDAHDQPATLISTDRFWATLRRPAGHWLQQNWSIPSSGCRVLLIHPGSLPRANVSLTFSLLLARPVRARACSDRSKNGANSTRCVFLWIAMDAGCRAASLAHQNASGLPNATWMLLRIIILVHMLRGLLDVRMV